MSKIIKAINIMISNSHLISNVVSCQHGDELFFLYNKKHKWSIVRSDGEVVTLNYYPGDQTLSDLASMPVDFWSEFSEIVTYVAKDLGGREAKESLNDLYRVVNEKKFGMDTVLDDIIKTDLPF